MIFEECSRDHDYLVSTPRVAATKNAAPLKQNGDYHHHANRTTSYLSSFALLTDDDEIWSRISAKRKEILGKSSFWLRSRPPRHLYKVRFDLGAPNPVRAGMSEENEVENMENIPEDGGNIYDSNSTDQLLLNRINNLQSFLSERKTRLRTARRRSKLSSGLIASADLTIQNSRKCLQKAKDARYGEIKGTIQKIKDSVPKEKTSQGESGSRCEECYRIMKERDKFWGLESDSEEEEFKNFNDYPPRRSMTKNSRTALDKKNIGGASMLRPKGIAGRGTWATPAYVPPWEVDKFESKRQSSMHTLATDWELEKARFGPKKGKYGLNLYYRKIALLRFSQTCEF